MDSFAQYLAGLDREALGTLLRHRPDARFEPVPRGFAQLAQRLSAPISLGPAWHVVDRDALVVAETAAALGAPVSIETLSTLPGMPEPAVRASAGDLCAMGLAWWHDGRLCLPGPLAESLAAQIGGGRPIRKLATQAKVEDLRTFAAAFGVRGQGLRKAELVEQVTELFDDPAWLTGWVGGLPDQLREQLELARHGFGPSPFFGPGARARSEELAAAGLVLPVGYQMEVPRELSAAAWLAERPSLTGKPDIPAAEAGYEAVRRDAQAAATELVRSVTTLLDAARSKPITALKKGGVGTRERSRLAGRLSLSAEVVTLSIDLAHAAGLLAGSEKGYAPTAAYEQWRAESSAHRWAALALAWFAAEHAPTSREIDDDGKEHPPPLPLESGAGLLRRALYRAARGGGSVAAAVDRLEWFCPLHGYEPEQRSAKTEAAVREGALLGTALGDVLTELGEHLLETEWCDAEQPVDELAGRVEPLLPELPCSVSVQSDLTVVVSGQPSPRLARLLETAAEAETRGTAGVWRFSPVSVRSALDTGWTAAQLTSELESLSGQVLPQPLEYLIADAERKHGQVRLRGARCCVLADEATVTELLHSRALGKLHLTQLAPTVLSSPYEPDGVLAGLRKAGFSPMLEDATGAVILEEQPDHQAEHAGPAPHRDRKGAAELAAALLADPYGEAAARSRTSSALAELNPHLAEAELDLLADAVDQRRDVVIAYRDKNGSRSLRSIQPLQLWGRWLTSWCHLRNGEREFTVANVESVGPASSG